ncbi:MAG: cupin domain-containing protein [Pirellulales bacterium]|nr:cupin domain-containing protein [Pirellulales bacterium]
MERYLRSKGPGSETSLIQRFRERGIEAIEDSSSGYIELSYDDCELLAEAYQVHRLLLDPALSDPSEDVCLVHQLDEFFHVGDRDQRVYGDNSEYFTPPQRLAFADDLAVVRVRIDPGGHSDTHRHDGDELIFVREGSVHILLRNSGLRAHLDKRDYIHFYSEQEHCVFNDSSTPAELFIIRFKPSSRRFALYRALRAKRPTGDFVARAVRELLASVAPYPTTVSFAEADNPEVLDRFGLARFLQLLAGESFRGKGARLTLDQLTQRAEHTKFNRAKFHRIHNGLTPLTKHDLFQLASIYEVAPILLFDYLFPVVRNAIVVRRHADHDLYAYSSGDYRTASAEFLPDSQSTYLVPCRRLADTDVAITIIQLSSGASTPTNRHPGHEILLPITGEVELRFGNTSTNISAERGQFAHFQAFRNHSVHNVGSQDAEVLVIRTYV